MIFIIWDLIVTGLVYLRGPDAIYPLYPVGTRAGTLLG